VRGFQRVEVSRRVEAQVPAPFTLMGEPRAHAEARTTWSFGLIGAEISQICRSSIFGRTLQSSARERCRIGRLAPISGMIEDLKGRGRDAGR
jgi:hypothetical protein